MKYQISWKQANFKKEVNKEIYFMLVFGFTLLSMALVFHQIYHLSQETAPSAFFPNYKHKEAFCATITAYNAEIGQTDSEPLIMASGKKVYPGAIACPKRFKFGDKVEIQGKIYICEDRMALRYRDGNYFDIYLESKKEAKSFGRKLDVVEVI